MLGVQKFDPDQRLFPMLQQRLNARSVGGLCAWIGLAIGQRHGDGIFGCEQRVAHFPRRKLQSLSNIQGTVLRVSGNMSEAVAQANVLVGKARSLSAPHDGDSSL